MGRKTHTTSPYLAEFRERAVQMVEEHLESYRSRSAAVRDIAQKLGCSSNSRRVLYKQAQRNAGKETGPTSAEKARIKKLDRGVGVHSVSERGHRRQKSAIDKTRQRCVLAGSSRANTSARTVLEREKILRVKITGYS